MTNLREESLKNWTSNGTIEHIQIGCMQRIADAMEITAKRNADLIGECERAKRSSEFWRQSAEHYERSNRSLKGQITKLRKKLAQACAPKEDNHD